MEQYHMPIVGLDLAGSERRPSGFAVLRVQEISMAELYGDAEILAAIRESQARLAMVDAPLSLLAGRHCIEDGCPCGKEPHFRQCDRELRRLGIKFFPITLGPMRALTRRGLRAGGLVVCTPAISGVGRSGRGLDDLARGQQLTPQ